MKATKSTEYDIPEAEFIKKLGLKGKEISTVYNSVKTVHDENGASRECVVHVTTR